MKVDWNETVGKIAAELGPTRAEELGELYLRNARQAAEGGLDRNWFPRWVRAIGNALLDQATFDRLTLNALEVDADELGGWVDSDGDIAAMIEADLERLRVAAENPDGCDG